MEFTQHLSKTWNHDQLFSLVFCIFDENLNKNQQKCGKMNDGKNIAETSYLDSKFP